MEPLIRSIYKDVLMRVPTTAEINAANSAFNNGQTTEQFISNLVNSQESVDIVQPVAGVYGALFGRTPDKVGLEFWVIQHRAAQDLDVTDTTDASGTPTFDSTFGREALISTLKLMVNPDQTGEFASLYGKGAASGRFYQANDLVTNTIRAGDLLGLTGQSISTGPSAAVFIDGLYDNILGRAPDVLGREFWIQQYNNRVNSERAQGSNNPENEARAFIIDRFVDGDEFQANIGSYLVQFLNGAGLDPDPADHYADPNDLANAGSLGNDAPELDDVTGEVAENSDAGTLVATLSATDRDFDDDGSFSINDPSGNFEIDGDKIVVADGADLDFEAETSFVVSITATDVGGLSDTGDVTINITDVVENTAPTFVTITANVDENSEAETVVATLDATDPDDGDTITYTLAGGNSIPFELDGDDIVIRDNVLINFETQDEFVLSITATDEGGLSSTTDFTVSVNDVNEAPVLTTPIELSVVENAAAGTRITTLTSTDEDAGDTPTYSIVDATDDFFEIVGDELRVKAGADFDAEAINPTVEIEVSDGSSSTTSTFNINVGDINEAPDIAAVTGSVNENATAGTEVAQLVITDPDEGDTVELEILDLTGFFELDDDMIVVRSGANLDFEDTRVFVVQVTATDDGGLSDTRNVTINLNDVNEAPTVDPTTGSVLENSGAGAVVASVSATDPDDGDDAPTLGIIDTSGNFELSGNNIVVRAGASLDFETQASYQVTVRAFDQNDQLLTNDETVTISILNAQENVPPVLVLSDGAVAENSATATPVVTLQSTDGNPGDSAVYTISDPSGLFQVNGDEIVVRAGADINFEEEDSYTVEVTVTDSSGATDTGDLTIDVVDVNEAPVLQIAGGTVAENSPGGTDASAPFSFSDPDDGDTVTISLTDPSGFFEIGGANNNQIVVKDGADIDFETASSHTITLVATDSSGLTTSEDFTIAVTDVVEAQTIILTTNADTPSDNSAGVNTLGTDGEDRYEGTIRGSDSSSTMNSNDVINGRDGIDTLDVRVLDTPDNGRVVEISTQSVEKIVFRLQPGDENAFATVDLTTADNVEELWVKDSPGDEDSDGSVFLQVDNLNPSDLDFIGLENVQGNVFVGLTGQGGRSNSDDDAIKLVVNGAKNNNFPISFLLNDDGGTTDTTFEILNIESVTNESEIDMFRPMTFTEINVTGDAKLTLTEINFEFEDLEKVEASGMTGGGLDISAKEATAADFTFIGSGFADRLAISSDLLDTASNGFLIDGGDGKDTVAVENFNLSEDELETINDATSIEVLEAYNSATSLEISEFDNIKEFVFAGSTTGNRINVRDIEDDNLIVFAADQTNGNAPVIRFTGEGAGTELFMELRSDLNDGGVDIIKTQGNSGSDEAAIDFSNISSVNIASTGEGDEANVINAVRGNNDRFAFDNNNITNFNITGTQDLTIGALAGDSKGQNRDVVGFSDPVNVDASDFEGNLRIAGSNSSSGDDIEGGSGDDIIYGIGDDDELTGNEGADQFRFSNFNDEDNEIMDFMIGEDKVGFHGEGSSIFADFDNTTASAEGTELDSDDYVENRLQINNISSSEDQKLVELQGALSSGQITSDTTNTAVDALVLVFNSTTEKAEMWHDTNWSDTGSRDKVFTFDNIETLEDMIGLSNTDFVEYLF